jgi:hypothetical protein
VRAFFGVFGIELPRNSNQQATVGRGVERSFNSYQELKALLKTFPPYRTVLYMKGHIMIFGGFEGEDTVIYHAVYGIKRDDGRMIYPKAVVKIFGKGWTYQSIQKDRGSEGVLNNSQATGLYLELMELKTQSLKELYEKDFYLWVLENLKLLKNKEYELVDWENILEEIEDMARRHYESVISYMAVIMEHLYKWEKFRENEYIGNHWKKSINTARTQIADLFDDNPSLRRVAQEKESLNKAWKRAVRRLVLWFDEDENKNLAKKYFGRLPTEEDFPKDCPYTFEQVMEYKPWLEEIKEDSETPQP